jgi:hypothetical protein
MNKYTKEMLEPIVESAKSFSDVSRAVGIRPASGAQGHLAKRIEEFGIDTSHFNGKSWSKGMVFDNRRKKWQDVLIDRSMNAKPSRTDVDILYRSMVESGVEEVCSECGQGTMWNGKPLTIQVDHLNGNPYDDRKENLRFLCPNCHTQTSNYGTRKRKIEEPKRCIKCNAPISRRNKSGYCQACCMYRANPKWRQN